MNIYGQNEFSMICHIPIGLDKAVNYYKWPLFGSINESYWTFLNSKSLCFKSSTCSQLWHSWKDIWFEFTSDINWESLQCQYWDQRFCQISAFELCKIFGVTSTVILNCKENVSIFFIFHFFSSKSEKFCNWMYLISVLLQLEIFIWNNVKCFLC